MNWICENAPAITEYRPVNSIDDPEAVLVSGHLIFDQGESPEMVGYAKI